MELGLSLGDASKSFGFLKGNISTRKQQKTRIKKSGLKLNFCMALGLTSVGNQEMEKSQMPHDEENDIAEDENENDQTSEEDESDDNQGETETPLQLSLLPLCPVSGQISSHLQSLPWSSDNDPFYVDLFGVCIGSSENYSSGNKGPPEARKSDVKRSLATAMAEEVSSANSTGSPFQMDLGMYNGRNLQLIAGKKRDFEGAIGNDVAETERASFRVSDDDDENGLNTRKKLRLSKEQSAFLEQSFKQHNSLNPKQKLALAKQLNLRPRQVEVWFQNRRARTKLKQTEVDCEYLKKCCETLTEENRRLHKELQDLRALKTSNPFYMQLPATTLNMCPSCERVATVLQPTSTNSAVSIAANSATTTTKAIPVMSIPRFYPFSQSNLTHPNQPAPS